MTLVPSDAATFGDILTPCILVCALMVRVTDNEYLVLRLIASANITILALYHMFAEKVNTMPNVSHATPEYSIKNQT